MPGYPVLQGGTSQGTEETVFVMSHGTKRTACDMIPLIAAL